MEMENRKIQELWFHHLPLYIKDGVDEGDGDGDGDDDSGVAVVVSVSVNDIGDDTVFDVDTAEEEGEEVM
eukprot:12001575-Ditylum_brightwellii.AAC.2